MPYKELVSVGMILAGLLAVSYVQAATMLNIWPGTAPGSERWNWKEQIYTNTLYGTVVESVVTPTLTAYLPKADQATGTGIVVAPGGACIALVMDREGTDVAHWLQQHGIAAFVLKYRLLHKTTNGMPKNLKEDVACKYGIADGIQAVKVVREHAKAWGIDPHRVGIMGFSAGGMIASEVLLQPEVAARPDFAALVYGAPFGAMPAVPGKLPPVFMAWAQDDTTAGFAMVRFYKALMNSGNKPETLIFAQGGHGFGMGDPRSGTAHWLDEFYYWLKAEKLIKPEPQ